MRHLVTSAPEARQNSVQPVRAGCALSSSFPCSGRPSCRFLGFLLFTLIFASPSFSQKKCDVPTIRLLSGTSVAQIASDDIYFNSSPTNPPAIGRPSIDKLREAHLTERTNIHPTRFYPDRIVPSDSADMAYDYGHAHLEFDETRSGKHISYDLAYLRVWKLVDGQCRLAASFSRPIDPPPSN